MATYGVGMSLKLSSDKAVNSIRNVKKELKNLKNSIKEIGDSSNKNLGNFFNTKSMLGWIGVLKEATSTMINASKAQTDYIENLNLLDTAYGTTENSGRKLIQTLSEVIGLDQSGLTRSLGTYRQMTSALGLMNDTAELVSENLLKMQLDMSSLYNLDFARAGQILQITLAGNTKSIRALGGDITEATLQQTAWNLGIEKSIDNMNRAEKTMLIYLTIEQQLKNSQGDLAKTIGSISNQTKIFTEQISMAGRQIGGIFIPILQALLPVLNGVLMAFNTVISGFLSLLGIDATSIADQFGTATSEIEDYTGGISNNIGSATNSAKELNKSLRDFDKLHVIKTPTTNASGGSAGGGGMTSGIGTIDESILEALKEYDLRLDTMNNKATEIRDRFLEWLDVFEILKDPLEKLAGITYDGLIYVWENVLKPLGNWVAWDFIPASLEVIGSSLNFIYKVLQGSKPYLLFIMEEILKPFSRTIGNTVVDLLQDISDFIDSLSNNKFAVNITSFATSLGLLYIAGNKLYGMFSSTKLGQSIKTFTSVVKLATKESGSFTKGLSQAIDIAYTTDSNMSKLQKTFNNLKTAIAGVVTTVVGLELIDNAIKDMNENGMSLGNTISLMAGVLSTVIGVVTTATAVMKIFNITLASNPILLVVTALAGLTIAIGKLVGSQKEAKESVEQTNNALKEQKEQASETAEKTLALVNRSEELVKELNNIVDSNGKVKKSDEDRAKVILGQLSDALGEEYELIDGVVYINGKAVNSYKDIKNAITKVIEEKKKESILNAYEEVYIQALKDRKTAYEELVKAREKGDTEAITRALLNYEKTTDLIDSYEQLMVSSGKTINTSLNNFYSKVGLMTDKAVEDAEYVVKSAQKDISGMTTKITIKGDVSSLRPNINSTLSSPFSINLKPKQSKLTFTPAGVTDGGNKSIYNIKFKKDGGFVDTGDLFVANEVEPEYIGKMGKKTAVANQNQIIEGIRSGTRQGYMEALTSTSSNKKISPIKIVAEGDTKGLLDFIRFKIDEEDRQFGL